SFTSLLAAVKATTLAAFSHQEVPFEKVVDAVVKDRDMSRSPVFQVMFNVLNTPDVPELKLGDVSLAIEGQEHIISKFDLAFTVAETPRGLSGTIQYSTDLYRDETIEIMSTHFQELLGSIVAEPGQQLGLLPMLTTAEENRLLSEFNTAEVVYPKNKSAV